jgi:hypothetical protein
MYNHTHTVINALERSYIYSVLLYTLLLTLSPERLSMFHWSAVPSSSGLWINGTLSPTNFRNMRCFTAHSSFSSRSSGSTVSWT